MNPALIPLVTGAEVAFWVAAPIAVLGALGLVLFRRAVYAALSMGVTMISLAVLYASLDAPLLAVVQIIVYTGAILMLFLFVMMMVGVDTPDSAVETIKGQRVWALVGTLGVLGLLVFAIGGSVTRSATGLASANAEYGGNIEGLAALLFGRYVFVFELTSALLITAAVSAMVLAHQGRVVPRKGQRELSDDRMRAYAEKGEHPGSLPNSGVFATHNSIGIAALLPDGSPAEKSVSQTLVMRGATVEPDEIRDRTHGTFAAIEAVRDDEEE